MQTMSLREICFDSDGGTVGSHGVFHLPLVLQSSTEVVVGFGVLRVECDGFLEVVSLAWNKPVRERNHNNVVVNFSAKLKNVRVDLKKWSRNISQSKKQIENCNKVICYLDSVET